jgi:hypothetical protein
MSVAWRRIAALLVVVGVALAVISALADPLGIGEGGGFGWKQAVGVVVGAVAALAGVVALRRRPA